MTFIHHKYDLPDDVDLGATIAVDTEALGLNPKRDKLCLVQLSSGDGMAHIVQLNRQNYDAPNVKKLLSDKHRLKIFHFARFDVAMIKQYLNIECAPIYCTKIASHLSRTYTNRHGLKDLIKELLNADISKHMQSSDWASDELSKAQMTYAAQDVLYLHRLKEKLDMMLAREGREKMAQDCFDFIATRVNLDLSGFESFDIFSHQIN